MALPSAYLTSSKNTRNVLAAMQRASVPQRFTYEYLKQLGFPSSTDRPLIPVLKALRLLDESGTPTDRYRRFKDPSQAPAVMAEAVREAYADVFAVDQAAHERNVATLKGIFARLSDKGDQVNAKMALTFRTLADFADFDATSSTASQDPDPEVPVTATQPQLANAPGPAVRLHHDVHIHLPISTDIAVYDAIFKSLREHLSE